MAFSFLVAAGIAMAGLFGLNARALRAQGPRPLVLAAVPLAVLFLAVAPPVGSIGAIQAFQAIARTGHSGRSEVKAVVATIATALLVGACGFVVVLAIAAWLGRRPHGELADSTSTEVVKAKPTWGRWVLAAAPGLLVPAWLLVRVMHLAANELLAGTNATLPKNGVFDPHLDLNRYSSTISKYLILGSLVGLLFCAIVTLAALTTQVAVRLASPSATAERVAYAALALLSVPILWEVVSVFATFRAF